MKVTPLTVTRRSLARVLAISATVPIAGSAQDRLESAAAPGVGSANGVASANDVALNAAREEFRTLGAIKIPRSLEPATRFEA
jgi:hypothetical protein